MISKAGSEVAVDDLDLSPGGDGEARPVYGPGFTNLLPNGDFENAPLAPWDTGGTDAARVTQSRAGTGAVRLGPGAFVVQTLPATPGTPIALGGWARTASGGGRLEVGFSFWGADGGWITDRTLVLPEAAEYADFLVDTPVPEGAATMTVWAWRESGSEALLDDLFLFRPDETSGPGPEPTSNLLSNGDFERGSVLPWDTGGSNVAVISAARSGSHAARLGSESFVVETLGTSAGERLEFSGRHRAVNGATGPREAGLSYWGATGEWLGDELVALPASSAWTEFRVVGTTPAGAVSVSAWVWSGLGSAVDLDDMLLERAEATGLTGTGGGESADDAPLVLMALRSARSLDLGGLVADSALGQILEIGGPVYARGWSAAPQPGGLPSARARALVQARGISADERKSLVVNFDGSGLVAARWRLDAPLGAAMLRVLVNGIERGRWFGGGSDGGFRTVAVPVLGAGLNTVEFRLEPGFAAAEGAGVLAELADFRLLRGNPEVQPDLAVSAAGQGVAGWRIFNDRGLRQTAVLRSRGAAPARFRVLWRNLSPHLEDGARISGGGGGRFHRVAYFSGDGLRRNLTSQILLGVEETALAEPGGRESYLVEVRARRPAQRRGYRGLVRATSPLRAARRDAVGIRAVPLR